MTQFNFELVSPEQKIMSEDVTMAVIPGTEGDFGVLAGHAPLVASVRMGVVDIYRENMKDKSERIFIAGGFADVTGDNCTLLAEQAVNVNDIDAKDIAAQITQAEEDINLASGAGDKARFQKRLDVLIGMKEAVS